MNSGRIDPKPYDALADAGARTQSGEPGSGPVGAALRENQDVWQGSLNRAPEQATARTSDRLPGPDGGAGRLYPSVTPQPSLSAGLAQPGGYVAAPPPGPAPAVAPGTATTSQVAAPLLRPALPAAMPVAGNMAGVPRAVSRALADAAEGGGVVDGDPLRNAAEEPPIHEWRGGELLGPGILPDGMASTTAGRSAVLRLLEEMEDVLGVDLDGNGKVGEVADLERGLEGAEIFFKVDLDNDGVVGSVTDVAKATQSLLLLDADELKLLPMQGVADQRDDVG